MKWPKTVTVGSVHVKVYEVKHPTNRSGKAYVLTYSTASGRKSKKFADPADALSEARLKASQLAAGRIEGAEMSRADRDELQAARAIAGTVPFLAALREWRRAHDLTGGHVITAAESFAARHGEGIKAVTVAQALKEFLAAKTKAGKQVATDHASIFTSIRDDLGALELGSVGSRQLDAWLAKRENPVSRNTYRKRVVSLWRWSQRRGYLPRDARTEAEMTERAHEDAPEIGIISAKTFEALLVYFRANHLELLGALVVAGFGGLRRAEVHAQSWADISLEKGHLRVTKGKRGTPARRLVPLAPAAVEWLMLCPERKGALCDGLAMDRIRLIARNAGFDLPENCFRHSYISHRVAATGDIPRVSLDAGNSPKEINRHYRELVSEAEGKEWFEITPNAVGEVMAMGGGRA